MNVLNPAALVFALIAVPIVLLYLLRLQRREQTVSSTLLWQQALLDREANTLWQKLRKNLLLFMQLATLAFLVFALLRPYVSLPGGLSGRLVILLDGSASMQASDVTPTRFERARAEASSLINGLGTSDEMMIILVDGSPRALSGITKNRADLNAALSEAKPSLTTANWSAAIALASSAASDDSTMVVISDGANADELKLINRPTQYIPIGTSGDNVSIANVTVRRSARGNAAFVRVANHGGNEESAQISLRSGERIIDSRVITIPAAQSAAFTLNELPGDVVAVRANIDRAANNALALDDEVYAVGGNASLRRALLVTRGNRFLEQALSSLPNLQVSRVISLAVAAGDRPYDLYVLDGASALPSELPPRANVLVIGSSSLFSATNVFSNTAFVSNDTHPIASGLAWRTVNVQQAVEYAAPAWLKPVILGQEGPLLLAGANPNADAVGETLGRVVLLPFELRRSDLPLQLAFPILMANSVDWLAPSQGLNIPSSVKPGDVVALPNGATVQSPDGSLAVVDARGFANTSQRGVYTVTYGELGGGFAVNFINSRESEIAPNPALQIGSAAGSSTVQAGQTQFSQREFWQWLAVLALLLLVAEWWVYQRGLPRFRRS